VVEEDTQEIPVKKAILKRVKVGGKISPAKTKTKVIVKTKSKAKSVGKRKSAG